MAKKLECNYDRNIFTQLEETIELTEKLQKEIKELKTTHRQEIYNLRTNKSKMGEKTEENLEKEEIKTKSDVRKEWKEKKEVYEQEIYLINAYYEQGIAELSREYTKEVAGLRKIIWEQSSEIARLKEENAGLRAIVNQNSGNSSKPPSSDGFKKIENSRAPTGRKRGGQQGHEGHIPVYFEKPTEIIELKVSK